MMKSLNVASSKSAVKSVALLLILLLLCLTVVSCSETNPPVVETDNDDSITYTGSPVVAEGAQVQLVTDNHGFTEGPVYSAEGMLYFVDVPFNTIFQVTPDGTCSSFVGGSGSANGLGISPDGVLYACLNGDRSIVAVDSDGHYTTVVDSYQGKRLNNPNDIWFDSKGGFYFTDPAYYLNTTIEQDGQYVYYVSPDRKTVTRVLDDTMQPNGLIGNADNTILYVADPGQKKVFSYTINDDGSLSNKQLFANNEVDGMTIDSEGNLYFSDIYFADGPGITVYNPAGELIESIAVPEGTSNCGFGGADKKTLYITARTSVYSLRMKKSGI